MTSAEHRLAAEPLDELDTRILDAVRAVYDRDPPPADLLARISLALDLETMHGEAQPAADPADRVLSRGAEHSRTITVPGDQLTLMLNITGDPGSTFVVDGYLQPPGQYLIELRVLGGSMTTTSDPHGRFALTDVPYGLVQLVVRSIGGEPAEPALVETPKILL